DKTNMFPLIQRCCFNTPFKLQKVTGPRLLLRGKNETPCCSPGPRPRPPSAALSLAPAAVCAAQLRAFRSSPAASQRKAPAESPAEWQKGRQSPGGCPRAVLRLSLGALAPFVAAPLAMALQGAYCPRLALAQVAYGAVTASFLGGVRWGFALLENGPARPDWRNLANGTVPPLLACQALLFKDVTEGAVMLVLALGIALHYDLSLLPAYPRWFKVLRVVGTVVMVSSLLATVALKAWLEEKESDDRKMWQN
ncbi:TMM69 protein, partial [Phainopepla nitens]|nr:TMM69 protein [Phainopepla nitens]